MNCNDIGKISPSYNDWTRRCTNERLCIKPAMQRNGGWARKKEKEMNNGIMLATLATGTKLATTSTTTAALVCEPRSMTFAKKN